MRRGDPHTGPDGQLTDARNAAPSPPTATRPSAATHSAALRSASASSPTCGERPASGSPAEGLFEQHKLRQNKILDKTFKLCNCENVKKYSWDKCARETLELYIHQ